MSRGPWKSKQARSTASPKMSSEEVATLKEEVREREESLRESDELDRGNSDRGRLAGEIERKRRVLQQDEMLIARGKDKDRLVREIREIEERIVTERPTTNEMNYRLGTPESAHAVQKNLEWKHKHEAAALRLIDLRRRLEPEDPGAGVIEYARPDQYRKKISISV